MNDNMTTPNESTKPERVYLVQVWDFADEEWYTDALSYPTREAAQARVDEIFESNMRARIV